MASPAPQCSASSSAASNSGISETLPLTFYCRRTASSESDSDDCLYVIDNLSSYHYRLNEEETSPRETKDDGTGGN